MDGRGSQVSTRPDRPASSWNVGARIMSDFRQLTFRIKAKTITLRRAAKDFQCKVK